MDKLIYPRRTARQIIEHDFGKEVADKIFDRKNEKPSNPALVQHWSNLAFKLLKGKRI